MQHKVKQTTDGMHFRTEKHQKKGKEEKNPNRHTKRQKAANQTYQMIVAIEFSRLYYIFSINVYASFVRAGAAFIQILYIMCFRTSVSLHFR